MKVTWTACAMLVSLTATGAAAQAVYKCKSQGNVTYSHEPCLNGKVVDTTPTQGLDKSSGKSLKGGDVLKNEQHKAFAEAFRPLTGMDAEQRATLHKRFNLSPGAKLECAKLDQMLPAQEAAALTAGKAAVKSAADALLETRKRFRDLRC